MRKSPLIPLIDVSAEAAPDAQVKLEEVFNWSDKETGDDDETSYCS